MQTLNRRKAATQQDENEATEIKWHEKKRKKERKCCLRGNFFLIYDPQ